MFYKFLSQERLSLFSSIYDGLSNLDPRLSPGVPRAITPSWAGLPPIHSQIRQDQWEVDLQRMRHRLYKRVRLRATYWVRGQTIRVSSVWKESHGQER